MSKYLLFALLTALACNAQAAPVNFSGVYPQEEAQFASVSMGDITVDLTSPDVMSTFGSGQPASLVLNYIGQPVVTISSPTLSVNVPSGTTSVVAAHFTQNGQVNNGSPWSVGNKSKQLSSQYTSDTLYIDCEVVFPGPPPSGTYTASVLVTSQ